MTATVRLTRRGTWAQKLDYSEAEQMLRAGATQQEVADRFDVSQAAVSNAIRRGVIKADTNRTETRAVPWSPIAPEHRDQYLVRMLRAYHRREKGLKSAPVIEAQLDTFLRKVEEGDWVVDYSPTDGFVRVPRREGVDLGLVREPGLDNRGRPRGGRRGRSPSTCEAAREGRSRGLSRDDGTRGGVRGLRPSTAVSRRATARSSAKDK